MGRILSVALGYHAPMRLLILGGSDGMHGAAALAGRAALKLGAGRVTIGTPTRLLAEAAEIPSARECPPAP